LISRETIFVMKAQKRFAPALRDSPSLTSINLMGNYVGPEGAKALAPALRDSPLMTSIGEGGLNLGAERNYLGAEGWGAIFAAVCSSEVSKITSIDASDERIGSEGAKLIAEALRNSVNASLTSINLQFNDLGSEGAKALAPAIRDSPFLTAADLSYNNLSVMAKLRLRKAVF
jgi:Ran GTPase-activating protein (RanGAP) involved in mRNA processing and transport